MTIDYRQQISNSHMQANLCGLHITILTHIHISLPTLYNQYKYHTCISTQIKSSSCPHQLLQLEYQISLKVTCLFGIKSVYGLQDAVHVSWLCIIQGMYDKLAETTLSVKSSARFVVSIDSHQCLISYYAELCNPFCQLVL